MQIIAYLTFNGQCEAAFRFYERVLGGKINTLMPHEGSPMADHVPPEWRRKILHAHMSVGDAVLLGADATPGSFKPPQGFSVSLQISGVSEAERIFSALSEGGSVTLALQETFWAARFGMFVDRFGIPWMVNCEKT